MIEYIYVIILFIFHIKFCSIVEKVFRIHLRYIKRFNVVELMSLSPKSTLKIIHLDGYVERIGFFKLLNNDDEKCIKNSTIN